MKLGEIKRLLKECSDQGDGEAGAMLESFLLIPEMKKDLLQYTPSRPLAKKSESFLNVIGMDENVYPMYLDRFMSRDENGIGFVASPPIIMKNLIYDFQDSEILSPYGDGRGGERIFRIPLTLDFYELFTGIKDGLRFFLALMVSYLFDIKDGVEIFKEKKFSNSYTGFSLNCPYADVMDVKTLIKYQMKLGPFLEGKKFKQRIFNELKVVTKNIIQESRRYDSIKILYCDKVKIVDFCYLCAEARVCEPIIKKVPISSNKILKENSKLKVGSWWSYCSKDMNFEVLTERKKNSSLFFNVVSNSLLKTREGHYHIQEEKENDKEKEMRGEKEKEGIPDVSVFNNVHSFLASFFESWGLDKNSARSLVSGDGAYIVDVPERILQNIGFFSRNRKKLFVVWSDFILWYEELLNVGVVLEKEDLRLGLIFYDSSGS